MIINSSWIYLFVKALRSHFKTPTIHPGCCKIAHSPVNTARIEDQLYPLVSIIIPARNEENNIERTLSSILSQNYPNFELIVVDDNSTDNTLRVIQEKINRRDGSITGLDRLKVISVTEKPKGWTGKTWASQQGYYESGGDLLLFTDADSYYFDKNAIGLGVSYMQKESLDVLTGVPFLELRDFWSRIVIPVWFLFTEVFGTGMADMNNPKSRVAYLMGSFFIIKRKVFEDIGSFQHVRDDIQEDRSLGIIIKQRGYNVKIFKVDKIIAAQLSRDLSTLWHTLRRTIAPIATESKLRVSMNLATIFFMATFPFIIFPYTLVITLNHNTYVKSPLNQQFLLFSSDNTLLFINGTSCFLVIIATAIKGFKKHSLIPVYSLLAGLGAVFLTITHLYYIIQLLASNKPKPIVWRGRFIDL
jgi:glycosyltransferase involved in cell wall biosynthesis